MHRSSNVEPKKQREQKWGRLNLFSHCKANRVYLLCDAGMNDALLNHEALYTWLEDIPVTPCDGTHEELPSKSTSLPRRHGNQVLYRNRPTRSSMSDCPTVNLDKDAAPEQDALINRH